MYNVNCPHGPLSLVVLNNKSFVLFQIVSFKDFSKAKYSVPTFSKKRDSKVTKSNQQAI